MREPEPVQFPVALDDVGVDPRADARAVGDGDAVEIANLEAGADLRLVGLASTVACLCCLIQFLLLRPLSAALVAPEVIWLSVLNASVCTVLPVLLVMMAIERIGASMTAQTGMLGAMSTILMGVVILGEPFTLWVAAGTVLVIVGIYVFSYAKN